MKSGPFAVALSGLLVSVTAMLLTLTANGPVLLNNMREFVEWYRTDQDLTGRWNNSNEGDIEPPAWSTSGEDAIFLELNAYQGEVSGTAVSYRLCKYSTHTDVFVEGSLRGSEGSLLFWDYVHGERRAFAKATIHLDRTRGLLDINVTEQVPDLFPAAFRVGKVTDFMAGDEGSVGTMSAVQREALKSVRDQEDARYRTSFCAKSLRPIL